MPEPEPPDPKRVAWEMLLNGWGYNWYRRDEQARADDLLIRSRACDSLHRAAGALRQAEAAFHEAHLPPPTREQPSADSARLAELRRMRAVCAQVDLAEQRVRGSAMPPDDRIWARHRANQALLDQLVQLDTALIDTAAQTEAAARGGSPEAVTAALDALQAVLRERQDLLLFRPRPDAEALRRFEV